MEIDNIQPEKSTQSISTTNRVCVSSVDRLLGFSCLKISDEEKLSYLNYFNSTLNVTFVNLNCKKNCKDKKLKELSIGIEEKLTKMKEVNFVEPEVVQPQKLEKETSLVYYNAVLNDKLTPTIHAYYFSHKQGYVQSDKEAASLKQIKNINMTMLDGDNQDKKDVNMNYIIHIPKLF